MNTETLKFAGVAALGAGMVYIPDLVALCDLPAPVANALSAGLLAAVYVIVPKPTAPKADK